MAHADSRKPRRRFVARLTAAVALVFLCYLLGTPRSGGPDEPSHMVASAALVRGQVNGQPSPTEPGIVLFDVPAMVGEPNPGCWALQPYVPADCAELEVDSTERALLPTTSSNYPPWTYVLPGLASFTPVAETYTYLARILMSIVPLILVVGALGRVRQLGNGAAAATLVGLTPIAWFSMTIVNPSAVAIAGGLALWVALFTHRRHDLLLVAAWAALLLPRRDGPVWATLIVIAVCAALSVRPVELWARYTSTTRWALVAITPIPVITAWANGLRDLNLALSMAPLALIGVDAVVVMYSRLTSTRHRAALVGGVAALTVGAVFIGLRSSPNGLDTEVMRLVVTNTGEHLRQLVGVLGWLDSPVPTSFVYLFWAAVGGLATVALLEQPRIAAVGLGVIIASIVTAWVLELGQGADYGQYWQGRYSMPFAVGLAVVLSIRAGGGAAGKIEPSPGLERLALVLAVVAWVILNVGFAAALQRWGVGVAGSWLPWKWGTYETPVPPVLLLGTHAIASGWLVALLLGDSTSSAHASLGSPQP